MVKFIFTLCIFILVNSSVHAQVVSKEIVENDSVKQMITATETDMYDGTLSVKANEYYIKGVDFGNKGDYEQAEKYYLKAIKEDPGFVEAYDNLGRVYRVMNNYSKAIEYYKKSIELYPDGPMAHQNLALVYGLQNNYEGAVEEYEEVIRIDETNPEGYYGVANSYMMLRKYEEGVPYAEKALEIYKEENSLHLGDGYMILGLLYYYMDDNDKARDYVTKAKELGTRVDSRVQEDLFGEEDTNEKEKTYVLENEDDYALYESDIVKMVDWLIYTPVDENPELRSEINAFVTQWTMGSPNVHIVISEELVGYIKCADCLVIYLGGWAKYCISTNDYDDSYKACLAAITGVIDFYRNNKKAVGKQKEIEKLMDLQQSNMLEDYIKRNLPE